MFGVRFQRNRSSPIICWPNKSAFSLTKISKKNDSRGRNRERGGTRSRDLSRLKMMLARKSKRKVVYRKLVVKMCSAIVSPNWMNTLKKASK